MILRLLLGLVVSPHIFLVSFLNISNIIILIEVVICEFRSLLLEVLFHSCINVVVHWVISNVCLCKIYLDY